MIEHSTSFSRFRAQSDGTEHGSSASLYINGESLQEKKVTVGKHSYNDREVLARLLQLGIADTLKPGHELNLDANEQFSRLIPVLSSYFSAEDFRNLVGEQATTAILATWRTQMLQNLFLEQHLQSLLHVFNEAAIPLILFKGPALAYTIYPESSLRTYHDFDMFLHPEDIERAKQLLTSMDYTPYDEYRVDAIDERRTGYNFIFRQPDSALAAILELHTAPHESEIGTLVEPDALWSKAIPITLLGEPALTMNPADHLLYLCWHYRFHGFSRLIWLYDIVMLIRTYGETLDWDALVHAARQQHLAATLYYCFSWCRDLFGITIPAHVLRELRPPLASRVIVERITLPNVALALATRREQERRIVARRVMVDTNIALLKAGLRVLFPSPTALSKRYMNHSRLPLQFVYLFYLIHPWITLAKGCQYFLLRHRKARGKK